MSKRAIVRFEVENLLESLGLPEDTQIRACRMTADMLAVEFQVKHPDLKEVDDAEYLPIAKPIIDMNLRDGILTFQGWGQ